MNDIREQLSSCELHEFYIFIEQLANQCRYIVDNSLSAGVNIQLKSDLSLVTDLDLAIERHIRMMIKSKWPEHSISGEEFEDESSSDIWKWVIDPIDGTEELVRGSPYWGIIIGLFYHNKPVVSLIDHPLLLQRFIAVYSQGVWHNKQKLTTRPDKLSSSVVIALPAFEDFLKHSSSELLFLNIVRTYPNYRVYRCCYGHSQILQGGCDAACEIAVHHWDLAATQLLMEETGLTYYSQICAGYNDRHIAVFGQDNHVQLLKEIFNSSGKIN
jgi:histidinol-phosphatase